MKRRSTASRPKAIDIKSDGNVTNVTVQQVQVGEADAFGAQTGSINIAGVRLAVRNGRVEGTTSDINAGNVKLKDGSIENVKLARPAFTVEPSGRYRASADLSLGGGVLGQMKLGPAHASARRHQRSDSSQQFCRRGSGWPREWQRNDLVKKEWRIARSMRTSTTSISAD